MALDDYPSAGVIVAIALAIFFIHYVLPVLHYCCIGACTCTKKKYGAEHEINVAITDVENEYSVSKQESKEIHKSEASFSRVLSMYFTLGAYAWIIYFAVTSGTRYDEFLKGTKKILNTIGYVHLPMFILFLWAEIPCSWECGYLEKVMEEESCKAYIQKLKEQKPTVDMVIGAYHYETRYTTRTYYVNGQMHQETQSYVVVIQDYTETVQFPFNYWEDYSADPSTLDLSPDKVTRVKMLKLILLGDEETKAEFYRIQDELKTKVQAKYPKSQIEFKRCDGIPLYASRLCAYWDKDEARWWTNKCLYIILSLLLLTWVYRIAFTYATQSTCFRVVKKIYISD